jgi:hypothetical protein
MAATLKRNKPYGESLGHPHVKFLQDDKFFNEQGEEITEAGEFVSDIEERQSEESSDSAGYSKEYYLGKLRGHDEDALRKILTDMQVPFDKRLGKEKLIALIMEHSK